MIFEGIRIQNDQIVFDFNDDLDGDVIPLKFQKMNKTLSTRNGVTVYFGYKYSNGANPTQLADVRDAIKTLNYNLINKGDLKLMINKAVNNFLKVSPTKFDIIITPKSSGGLVNLIAESFKQKLGNSVMVAPDTIVKNAVSDIKIDPTKIHKLTPSWINSFEKIIQKGSFKMKSVPIPLRRVIIDFLKFNDATSREIYNKIANGNVLILDDIYTGGSTFSEIVRIINNQSPRSVSGFIFLLSS